MTKKLISVWLSLTILLFSSISIYAEETVTGSFFFRDIRINGTQILNSNNPRLPNYLLYQEIIALPEIEKGYSRHFKFLKAQNITIPTLDITKKYMSIVSNMLLQQRKIIKENQQLQSLRDFLLPMLMNGQVIIED